MGVIISKLHIDGRSTESSPVKNGECNLFMYTGFESVFSLQIVKYIHIS
jgi:hypothetical protein